MSIFVLDSVFLSTPWVMTNMPGLAVPTQDKIESYATAIISKHPALKSESVWSSMGRLKHYLEESPNYYIQHWFSNVWTHDHYFTNILVLAPDGTGPISFFNVPWYIHEQVRIVMGKIQCLMCCRLCMRQNWMQLHDQITRLYWIGQTL